MYSSPARASAIGRNREAAFRAEGEPSKHALGSHGGTVAGQERHPEHAPDPGRRAAGAAPLREPSLPFVEINGCGFPFTTAGFARMIERTAAGASVEHKALHAAPPPPPWQTRATAPGHHGAARASVDHQHGGVHHAGAEPV
jgi:hypothetical protein